VSDQFIFALLPETSHNAASSVVIIIVSHACEKINKILLTAKAMLLYLMISLLVLIKITKNSPLCSPEFFYFRCQLKGEHINTDKRF